MFSPGLISVVSRRHAGRTFPVSRAIALAVLKHRRDYPRISPDMPSPLSTSVWTLVCPYVIALSDIVTLSSAYLMYRQKSRGQCMIAVVIGIAVRKSLQYTRVSSESWLNRPVEFNYRSVFNCLPITILIMTRFRRYGPPL